MDVHTGRIGNYDDAFLQAVVLFEYAFNVSADNDSIPDRRGHVECDPGFNHGLLCRVFELFSYAHPSYADGVYPVTI